MADRHIALAREEIIEALTSWTGITSADGATPGNNTLIDSLLIGRNDFITGKTILIGGGFNTSYEDKGASSFDPLTGMITVSAAFSAQIKAGTIYRVLNLSSASGISALLNAIKAKTDLIPADIGTQLDTNIPAIKARTDNLPATPANEATVNAVGVLATAIKAVTDSLVTDIAQATGTFSFDESSAAEQTAFSVAVVARAKVGSIWLDLNNLTMNCTIRIKHKIDGTTYRTFSTHSFVFATDDKGVLLEGFTAYRDFQVTMQCGGGGVAGKNVPYAVV